MHLSLLDVEFKRNIVGDNLLAVMDNSKQSNALLKNKVAAGKLGFKSGEGFYTYNEAEKEAIKNIYYRKLIAQLKTSKKYI